MARFFAVTFFVILSSFTTPNGIRYQHVTNPVPQSIHILEIDPHRYTIVSARALDQCIGRENVLSISKRKGAICAVNGGFFSMSGAPSGILKIKGQWYSLPSKPRGAIGWKADGQTVIFDRVLTHLEGINFQIDPKSSNTTTEMWGKMDYIVGGAPLLIQNGVRISDFSIEKTRDSFLTGRHARTALGILDNGNWIFVVVDGKNPVFSIGMTVQELAIFMEGLGCRDALNLDGGGSSTLIFDDNVVNRPAGDGDFHDDNGLTLRDVSDAILIFEKKGTFHEFIHNFCKFSGKMMISKH